MKRSVFVTAPAKVNLCLHIGETRADGYHDLESFVAFAALGDKISIGRDVALSNTITGPFGAGLPPEEGNLVFTAARKLAHLSGTRAGARIKLEKNIPVAAGLGGGSADAAATLCGLNELWELGLDTSGLRKLAATIGADVPVCVESRAAWMEGRGERITQLPPLPRSWLLLVNPGVAVSTRYVFASLRRRRGLGLPAPDAPFEDAADLARFLQTTINDLESPARSLVPAIGDVLEELGRIPDVLLARMSGSGATCFGLFDSSDAAGAAGARMRAAHPEWWVAETELFTDLGPI